MKVCELMARLELLPKLAEVEIFINDPDGEYVGESLTEIIFCNEREVVQLFCEEIEYEDGDWEQKLH